MVEHARESEPRETAWQAPALTLLVGAQLVWIALLALVVVTVVR
jgi:hypothetical protein